MLRRGDIALAVGVMAILVVLILPLPPILLDLALAISIILSVLILMTALFIQTPLEFSSFPTVLLIATMLRLVAQPRLDPPDPGARPRRHRRRRPRHRGVRQLRDGRQFRHRHHRVHDPGDRELRRHHQGLGPHRRSRGALQPRRHARQADGDRRRPLGRPDRRDRGAHGAARRSRTKARFFGAMDGASKFVRGDAIAGLLVVFINVIGGMIIGIAQQGMPFAEAARTYTLLTVGDGLVTQVPALIVSTAAGLLVSKAGVSRRRRQGADRASSPAIRRRSACRRAVMVVMALLPGMPMLPFLLLGGGAGALAYHDRQAQPACRPQPRPARPTAAAKAAAPTEEPISAALKIDDLKIELGYALLPLVNAPDGTDRLTEQIKALRRSLAMRDGLRDAGGAHPRQRAARGQRLRDQDQGGRRRRRPHLAEPVHGHGPGRRAGGPARHPHHRADLRPAGDLGRCRAQGRGRRSRATRWSMPRPCCRRI